MWKRWIAPRVALLLATLFSLAGCTLLPPPDAAIAWPQALQRLLPTDVLLLGERHDAPEHQALQRLTVEWLAQRGQLAALVLEMADAGHSTRSLGAQASEAQVQSALGWNDALWPWHNYGPVVMAAVRAGVPVLGGNLPRPQLHSAQADTRLDILLTPAALERQRQAVREGHCGLLPEAKLPGMARVQVARDESLARTATAARQPAKVVLLVAGAAHVQRSLGVPVHLPPTLISKVVIAHTGQADSAMEKEADWWHATPALPPDDACEQLRQLWQTPPAR